MPAPQIGEEIVRAIGNLDGTDPVSRPVRERLRAVSEILGRKDVLELMAQAHDIEESAKRGEPDPWGRPLMQQYVRENGQGAWDEWTAERRAAMRAALEAVGLL